MKSRSLLATMRMQIAWRATRIETFRKELVTLPNNVVAKGPVKNYSRGDQPVGIDLSLGVAYGSPPNRVRQIVHEVFSSFESGSIQQVIYQMGARLLADRRSRGSRRADEPGLLARLLARPRVGDDRAERLNPD